MVASHPPEPRNHLSRIPDYAQSKKAQDFGRRPGTLIKLSSNEMAWGPAEAAVTALRRHADKVHLYPESQSQDLLEKIAERHKLNPGNVVLGNGSNEIIQFLIQAYAGPRDHILVPEVTFSMYQIYAAMAGIACREAPLNPSLEIDLAAMKTKITARTRILFLATPNNPTGYLLPKMELELFLLGLSKKIIVVIDEAYADFAEPHLCPNFANMIRSGKYPNLVVLRTFSKSFGLAGLRLGYALAQKNIIEQCHKVRQPFNVSGLAIVAANASLQHNSHLRNVIQQVRSSRDYLERKLMECGIPYLPSQANFVTVRVGSARQVTDQLGAKGFLVRALDSFGLPEYIRVTVSKREHMRQFMQALNEVLSSRG